MKQQLNSRKISAQDLCSWLQKRFHYLTKTSAEAKTNTLSDESLMDAVGPNEYTAAIDIFVTAAS